MPVLPRDYQSTTRILQTLQSLPATGRFPAAVGYTAAQIYAQYNILFPDNPLSLSALKALLVQGSKTGVFLKGGCRGSQSAYGCTEAAYEASKDPDLQTYYTNVAMASVNPVNLYYQALATTPNPCPNQNVCWDNHAPGANFYATASPFNVSNAGFLTQAVGNAGHFTNISAPAAVCPLTGRNTASSTVCI